MGKKNKNELKNDNSEKPKDLGVKNKIQKKSKKEKVSSKIVESKKPNKIIFNDDEVEPSQEEDVTQLNNSTTIKQNKTSRKKDKNTNNKKIIFGDDDDEPREVSVNKNVGFKQKKTSNQNYEEEPKDEDIDKFCDELDEEDNKQYESWIELLEAKLRSNKKKV